MQEVAIQVELRRESRQVQFIIAEERLVIDGDGLDLFDDCGTVFRVNGVRSPAEDDRVIARREFAFDLRFAVEIGVFRADVVLAFDVFIAAVFSAQGGRDASVFPWRQVSRGFLYGQVYPGIFVIDFDGGVLG